MEKPKITIYGTTWCRDCYHALNILKSYKMNYLWIDIDQDQHAEKFVIQTNRGFRSVPTIIFEDGSILVEPTPSELQSKLIALINLNEKISP